MTHVNIHIHGAEVKTQTTAAAEAAEEECGCAHKHVPPDASVVPCPTGAAEEGRPRETSAQKDVVQRTVVQLLNGKRLEVEGKGGDVIYMGSSNVDRRDPFWYEHKGGRTYKETPEEVVRAVLPHVGYAAIDHAKVYASEASEGAPVVYEASPLASAAGAAVGTAVATALAAEDAGDCMPWVKIQRDPEAYGACLERARKIGPITDAAKVYELLHGEFDRRDQETFVVVPCDVRGQLRQRPIEVAYGQRSRVAVGVNDVMRAVLVSGCEYFVVAHGHPSGKCNPSKADRDLTKSIEDAVKLFNGELTFADHVVLGAGEFFSIKENKLYKAAKAPRQKREK